MESSGSEATELADRAGLHLDDWQGWVLEQGLGERADGDWAAFESCIVVPRQNGKGAIIEALCLAGLFLFEDRLTIYSAHEFKTAQETFRRVDELLAGSDWLSKKVIRKVQSTNESGFELRNGCRLRFLARSKGSGRGFSSRRVIFDEAYDLPATAMSAVMPTLLAQRNAQVWYFSSAGQDDSDTLRALRVRGLAGSERLMYADWSAEDGADPADMDAIAAANPALGIRISEQSIEDMRRSLDPTEFAREVMGVWDDPEKSGRVISADLWASCVHDRVKPETMTFAVDVSPMQDWAAIAAAWVVDGVTHVEVTGTERLADHREGTTWVVPRLGALALKHGAHVAVAHGSQAAALIPDLERAGVLVDVVKSTDVTSACGAFVNLATDGRLAHHSQEPLDKAVANAQRKDVGDGAWIWGRRKSPVDITPLYAATLAAWQAGQPPEPEPAFYSWAQLQDDEEQ